MFRKFNSLKKWQLCCIVFFVAVLSSLSYLKPIGAVVRSSQLTPHIQQGEDPQIKVAFFDYGNAPFTITKVLLASKELSSGELVLGKDGWSKDFVIEGVNKSNKVISYVSYALDFTIIGEDSLYRLKLDAGEHYFNDGRKSTLQIAKGQKAKVSISDKAWDYSSPIISKINQKRLQVTKVELSLEAVYFEDDTLFTFGSWLKRSRSNPNKFIGIDEKENVSAKIGQQFPIQSRNSFVATGPIAKSQNATCYTYVPSTMLTTHNQGANKTQVTYACNPNS